MAEYANDFENGAYAGQGMAPFTQTANATSVDGGNSQFVVEYLYGADGGAADVGIHGGNNQFVIRVDGSSGGNTITVDGGNNQFVVALEDLTGGGNLVDVKGGNNQFVVVFDYASGKPTGDVVNVSGDNNHYGIAHDYTAVGGDAGFTGDFGGGAASFPGAAGAGDQGGTDPAAFGQAAPSAAQQDAGSDLQGSAADAPPVAGFDGQGAGAVGGTDGGDLASLLRQSPFGRLLDVPGGAEGFEQAIAARSAADQAAGVANPFGNVAPGENPFSSLGQPGAGSGQSGNPFAGGGAPAADASGNGGNPSVVGGAPAETASHDSGNPAAGGALAEGASGSGGGDAGGNPSAGPDAASFFGPQGQSADPNYAYDLPQAGQGGGLAEGLAASPFGPLLDLPGYTVDDLVSALDGNPNYNQDIA